MAEAWTSMTASDIRPGAVIRLASGRELEVSRIEPEFLGMPNLIAFIEDTSRQWYKAPMPADAVVEVRPGP